ncbi:MAG: hypothetical protein AMJ56_07675 [Anaerolineae bacterium SG8_19]|nr:MAG: hypothetical protein AMJ56_07675 [Anaerolineae bacterium SG8_19]
MYTGLVISAVISLICICFTWGVSYQSYIGLKKKLAVVEQYKETVELYADKGVKEFTPSVSTSSELTDLKYNNYQTQIGEMIREMRDLIVQYNATVTSKRVMKDCWFFSWLIILPEDMKTIKMGDYLQ